MARPRTRSGKRLIRHARVRRRVVGTTERPRLAVFRSLGNIYAQIIDDVKGTTLVAASTMEKDAKGNYGGNVTAAGQVGKRLAERAVAAGVGTVVFDRNGFKYHGRVKGLADGAREGGLKF